MCIIYIYIYRQECGTNVFCPTDLYPCYLSKKHTFILYKTTPVHRPDYSNYHNLPLHHLQIGPFWVREWSYRLVFPQFEVGKKPPMSHSHIPHHSQGLGLMSQFLTSPNYWGYKFQQIFVSVM